MQTRGTELGPQNTIKNVVTGVHTSNASAGDRSLELTSQLAWPTTTRQASDNSETQQQDTGAPGFHRQANTRPNINIQEPEAGEVGGKIKTSNHLSPVCGGRKSQHFGRFLNFPRVKKVILWRRASSGSATVPFGNLISKPTTKE